MRWPKVQSLVAVDTETSGLHPDPPENGRVTIVSLAWRPSRGAPLRSLALPFAFGAQGDQPALALWEDPNRDRGDWEGLLAWLTSQKLVMHGAKFDLHMFAAGTPQWEGKVLAHALAWDTMLGSRDLDPTSSAELEDVERRMGYLDRDQREAWHKAKVKRGRINDMEWATAERYACVDAEVTLTAAEQQMERYATGEGDRRALEEDLAVTRSLLGLELRGIGYDAARSVEIGRDIFKEEARIRTTLPFRATVPGAKKWFYTVQGLEPSASTASGDPKLDDLEITRLVAEGAPFAEPFQRLRKLETARTKWFESYAEHTGWDGRLRTVFSLAKVISGRLSSTRVNLQAIPHDYQMPEVVERWGSPRGLFKPRESTRLWELDLSQAELRVAAVEARCEAMLAMIADEEDVHGNVAQQLFGDTPGTPTWTEHRQIGKRADFSFIFGVGAETFQTDLAKQTGVWRDLHECNRIVQDWRRLFPEYGRAIHRYMESANHWGYVRLVNGRVRRFASYEDRHKAFNQYVQGSLAELMKAWLVEADAAFPDTILLTIHDSLVLETADEDVVREVQSMGAAMGTEMFAVPMVVDMKEWIAA